MAKAKTAKPSDIIHESIKIDGATKEHALKALFDDDNAPTMVSIGYARVPGTNRFISYIITSEGTEIKKIEVSEPDHRSIAEDEAKINFVNCFMAGAGK